MRCRCGLQGCQRRRCCNINASVEDDADDDDDEEDNHDIKTKNNTPSTGLCVLSEEFCETVFDLSYY